MKIEKGVPIPTRSNNSAYPWEQMDVGDSFTVDGKEIDKVRQAASQFTRRNPKLEYKITTRKIKNNEYRVWRTA